MDILALITTSDFGSTFFDCSVQRTADGTHLYRAHFSTTRRSGAPATKLIELEIDCDTFANSDAPMRQRTGFLYNERAQQWSIPAPHRSDWLLFARYVASTELTQLMQEQADVEHALKVIPAR